MPSSYHHHHRHWIGFVFTMLIIFSLLSLLISIIFGSVHLSTHEVYSAWRWHSQSISHQIVFQFRLPRAACAFITGGLLGLAGALMQTLLRNPLADPYVLGISGGSSAATLLAILLGVSSGLNVATFLGSMISMILVLSLVRVQGQISSLKLLLTGIVVAMGWSAIISLILTVAPDESLRGMFFWLMGDLTYAHFSWWQPGILLAGFVASFVLAKPLNVLSRGELTARSLGVNTHRLYCFLYLVSSILTACAVSIAGCIGFIGLIVPHMLRLMGSSDHRFVLPASILLGGSFLTCADVLARSIVSPTQLPVGMVTAIIGVPCFLVLLRRGNSS